MANIARRNDMDNKPETREVNEKKLKCAVEVGQYGVCYSATFYVMDFGKIKKVSPETNSLLITDTLNGNEAWWDRDYVEVFDTKKDAEEKFNLMLSYFAKEP